MQPTRPEPWKQPFPLPERLETPRLVVRAYAAADAPALFDSIRSSKRTLLPWLSWIPTYTSLSVVEKFIADATAGRGDLLSPEVNNTFGATMGIFEREGGAHAGAIGFVRLNAATHTGEIGYWLRSDREGRGYVSEALPRVISWGLTPQGAAGWGFRRVHLQVAGPNAKSQAVPRRLGLRQESHTRQSNWLDGVGYIDMLGWGVLAEEWDALAHRLKQAAG